MLFLYYSVEIQNCCVLQEYLPAAVHSPTLISTNMRPHQCQTRRAKQCFTSKHTEKEKKKSFGVRFLCVFHVQRMQICPSWQHGWEFPHRFSEQIARFLQKNERMSESLKNERFAHLLICSFLVSDFSDSLMVAQFW